MTDAESVMWRMLRGRRLQRWKFRRQHRLGIAIVDFYCPRLRIAIELDGEPHYTEQGRRMDIARDRRLLEIGIAVLRFENRELIANPKLCEERIAALCEARASEIRGQG